MKRISIADQTLKKQIERMQSEVTGLELEMNQLDVRINTLRMQIKEMENEKTGLESQRLEPSKRNKR